MLFMILFAVLMLASCGYAIICGGPSERSVAAVMVIGAIGSALVAHPALQVWHSAETGIFAIDVAALIAFAVITLFSTRFWPIWTTAFQLLSVMAHFGPLIVSAHTAIPFALAEEVWGYVILVQLIFVTRSRRKSVTTTAVEPLRSFWPMQHR